MEKLRKLKKDADIRYKFCWTLHRLDIISGGIFNKVFIEKIILEHDLSGEEWDD